MKKISIIGIAILVVNVALMGVQSFVSVGSVDTIYQSLRQKKKLFQSVGCLYVNEMINECQGDLQNPYQTEYYKKDASHIDALSKQYASDVISKALAPMYLKFISPTVGYGVFATKPIEKGQFIGIYAGELREVGFGSRGKPEDVDYAWYYTVDSADNKKLIIDGKYKGNELRFINHDNNPNTVRIDVIVNKIFYVCYIASRYIPQSEQLTVHYGDGYWSSRHVNPAAVSV